MRWHKSEGDLGILDSDKELDLIHADGILGVSHVVGEDPHAKDIHTKGPQEKPPEGKGGSDSGCCYEQLYVIRFESC